MATSARAALWVIDVRGCPDETPRAWRALLPEDELTRAGRFRLGADRTNFLVARVVVRRALSALTGVAPREVALVRTDTGRPETGFPELDVNVSHTRGVVAVVLGRGTRVGVDVERGLEPSPRTIDRVLLPQERDDDFLTAWTRAESVMKWAGTGLAAPPSSRRVVSLGPRDAVYTVAGRPLWCSTLPTGGDVGLSVCLGHPLTWAATGDAAPDPLVPGATVQTWVARGEGAPGLARTLSTDLISTGP